MRKIFRRYIPDVHAIRNNKNLRIFGDLLHDPNLWHLNKHSVSGAFLIGVFAAFIPIPFQMPLAAAFAILARVNLPLAVALVWITNPVTMPAIYFFCYKIGAMILGTSLAEFNFELSWEWLATDFKLIWQPFLLGCFVIGVVSSVSSYFLVRYFWRFKVIQAWEERKLRRQQKKENGATP